MFRYLADLKAEISSSNNAPKQRPIHWAAVKGDIDTVNLLCKLFSVFLNILANFNLFFYF